MAQHENSSPTDSGWHILIVDSNTQTHDLLGNTLACVNREFTCTTSVAEAQIASANTRFDLAIIEQNLPDGSGLELVSELRQHNPELEVIVVSGAGCTQSAIEAMQLGALDYWLKPITNNTIIKQSARKALAKMARDRKNRRLHAKLRESEERYELAAMATNDGLWDWDLATNDIYFSPRWLAILGLENSSVGTSPDEWFGRVHTDDLEIVKRGIAAQMNGETDCFEAEYRMTHRDGTYSWVCTRGVCLRDRFGKPYRMAGSHRDVNRAKQMEARLVHDALHDSLTGLPNRELFRTRLEHAHQRLQRDATRKYAVLFIDLDRFKKVNDSLGHQAGDELLIGVSQRIRGSLRAVDTLARLGGDEFAVLVEDVDGISGVKRAAERIENALAQPFVVCGQEVVSSASIGIALSKSDYQTSDELLRDADIAMYQAKAAGKARYEIFDAGMHSNAVRWLETENEMRSALENDEFSLHYQPIVEVASGTLVGFEALARWQHPDRGWVSPVDFIPVAEETGLIVPLGDWVLRQACTQLAQWRSRTGAELFMSVNLSPKQFDQPDLLGRIASAINDAGIEPRLLKLEITEGVFIKNVERIALVLEEMRAMGLSLLLDDFGTGYSSLSYLHRLPLDVLKIDRAFVSQMGQTGENTALVAGIVTMATALGIEVVAEGIETAQQAQALTRLGCTYGQGYRYAKPLQPDVAERFIIARNAAANENMGVLSMRDCAVTGTPRSVLRHWKPVSNGSAVGT